MNTVLHAQVKEISIISGKSTLGGPSASQDEVSPDAYLASVSSIEEPSFSGESESIAGIVTDTGDAVMNPNHPSRDLLPSRVGTISYNVQKGDTLSGIAKKFNISLATILSANGGVKGSIKQGQTLAILPISGVLHIMEEGETLNSIAQFYGIDLVKILKANTHLIEKDQIGPGATIIVPGAKERTSIAALASHSLPDLGNYFGLPAAGYNWGKLHADNAVDIANVPGTPIYSAAEGLVTRVGSPTQWNTGYGGVVDIGHPNNTSTRYAHMEKVIVQVGDYVKKGEQIGLMGNTGNVQGLNGGTGYHLHFETHGAKNPFSKE